ncbi:MAG: hypothetical protein HC789_18815 [Microcoleus sp. CSU_2_2]|nr:hypothetical protein [Microcoleus sp. CSU_2_2]
MRRYVQLSLQTEIKRATHHTIYNGSESPGFTTHAQSPMVLSLRLVQLENGKMFGMYLSE